MPDTAITDTTNLIGRFQIDVSEASLANSNFPARPSSRIGTTGSSPNGISNIAGISGPGPQSRTAVAVDPPIPMHMAGASNDYATGTVKMAATPNGGKTLDPSPKSRTVGNHKVFIRS